MTSIKYSIHHKPISSRCFLKPLGKSLGVKSIRENPPQRNTRLETAYRKSSRLTHHNVSKKLEDSLTQSQILHNFVRFWVYQNNLIGVNEKSNDGGGEERRKTGQQLSSSSRKTAGDFCFISSTSLSVSSFCGTSLICGTFCIALTIIHIT